MRRGVGATTELEAEVALRHVGRRDPHLTVRRELGFLHAFDLVDRHVGHVDVEQARPAVGLAGPLDGCDGHRRRGVPVVVGLVTPGEAHRDPRDAEAHAGERGTDGAGVHDEVAGVRAGVDARHHEVGRLRRMRRAPPRALRWQAARRSHAPRGRGALPTRSPSPGGGLSPQNLPSAAPEPLRSLVGATTITSWPASTSAVASGGRPGACTPSSLVTRILIAPTLPATHGRSLGAGIYATWRGVDARTVSPHTRDAAGAGPAHG